MGINPWTSVVLWTCGLRQTSLGILRPVSGIEFQNWIPPIPYRFQSPQVHKTTEVHGFIPIKLIYNIKGINTYH
jgi:hypothetical protein